MIQYALKCVDGHGFESWFQSADAFDKLSAAGMVSCAVCGRTEVEKAIMTPRVGASRDSQIKEPGPLSHPASPAEQALAELRRKIETESDYVGVNFAAEARAMHEGDAPTRSIYGEARLDEARKLLKDGVPVAPLPFMPNRKTN
ncbi:DUF1178 family protein [Sedimentitalea nanhaiensis]|uniref:DUF1178 family protein n=1 Tax=Sedimentitalea nanhaiensis TaxID=999627 RepID=A0A1I6ZKD7_9RHOB|nr:DUF1178 family protein [Sedimentitalea nanhaiensis]SFT63126.1 hypothetical protein SAMN05216236_104165 [Sedimentitalea nanhaiensis]